MLQFSRIITEPFSLLKLRLFLYALLVFLCGRYYRLQTPFLLGWLLRGAKAREVIMEDDLFGGMSFFHRSRPGCGQLFVKSLESRGLLQRPSLAFRLMAHFPRPASGRASVMLTNPYSPDFVRYLQRNFPDWTLSFRFNDVIDGERPRGFKEVVGIAKKSGISATSYDRRVCGRFGLEYVPNRVNREKVASKAGECLYDTAFVGHLSPAMLGVVRPLLKAMRSEGLTAFPIILDCPADEIEGYRIGRERVSYDEYLSIMGRSRAIIGLWRLDPDEGYSYRVDEAMGRKVITNRAGIRREAFYDPSRFFIIGKGDVSRVREFLDAPPRGAAVEELFL